MTLEPLDYLSQIVAVLLIIASLGAVYWQVRLTNQIARATLTQSTWMQTGQMQLSLYDTPAKAELMHRASAVPLLFEHQKRCQVYLQSK